MKQAKFHHITTLELEQIATLYATGRSANSIADAIGRDRKTVVLALKRDDTQTMIAERREDLGEMFSQLSRRALESITDADLAKESAYRKALIGSIAYDKFRLATGQSTQNLAVMMAQAVITAQEAFDSQENLDHLQIED